MEKNMSSISGVSPRPLEEQEQKIKFQSFRAKIEGDLKGVDDFLQEANDPAARDVMLRCLPDLLNVTKQRVGLITLYGTGACKIKDAEISKWIKGVCARVTAHQEEIKQKIEKLKTEKGTDEPIQM